MFIELTVKALTFALRHRLDTQKSPAQSPAARASQPAEPDEIIV
jgi:hypothetical protein